MTRSNYVAVKGWTSRNSSDFSFSKPFNRFDHSDYGPTSSTSPADISHPILPALGLLPAYTLLTTFSPQNLSATVVFNNLDKPSHSPDCTKTSTQHPARSRSHVTKQRSTALWHVQNECCTSSPATSSSNDACPPAKLHRHPEHVRQSSRPTLSAASTQQRRCSSLRHAKSLQSCSFATDSEASTPARKPPPLWKTDDERRYQSSAPPTISADWSVSTAHATESGQSTQRSAAWHK